ncbi:MAG: hypothetical protein HY301_16240 [Verrucomicrobia bacterium]|nr:hypothetical protein [Verrucomicrobiota bacterium]
MSWQRKTRGGVIGLIGFMLSPLSWWNDLFVNFPLALGFAWCVSLFWKPAFGASFMVGYWLTNVLGFVLMQKGAQQMWKEKSGPYSKRALLRDLVISLIYTLLIVVLIRLKVLQPVQDYLSPSS